MKSRAAKAIILAAAMVGMAAPVHAQINSQMMNPDKPAKTQDQIERDKQTEQKYKDSLHSIPDAKNSNDPWHIVRGSDTDATPPPKVVAKPAKPKTAKRSSTTAAASPWPAPRQNPAPWPGSPSQPQWPTPR